MATCLHLAWRWLTGITMQLSFFANVLCFEVMPKLWARQYLAMFALVRRVVVLLVWLLSVWSETLGRLHQSVPSMHTLLTSCLAWQTVLGCILVLSGNSQSHSSHSRQDTFQQWILGWVGSTNRVCGRLSSHLLRPPHWISLDHHLSTEFGWQTQYDKVSADPWTDICSKALSRSHTFQFASWPFQMELLSYELRPARPPK